MLVDVFALAFLVGTIGNVVALATFAVLIRRELKLNDRWHPAFGPRSNIVSIRRGRAGA